MLSTQPETRQSQQRRPKDTSIKGAYSDFNIRGNLL